MIWELSHRADPAVVPIADRHYNRQKPGTPQFVPPGRCLVLRAGSDDQLRTPDSGGAFWVTSWPFAEYVNHAWPGAWVCSAFRNEGAGVASEMIVEAVQATVARWPEAPAEGFVSFIDPSKVRPSMIRGRKTWGQSWFRAGFEHVGYSKGGLWAMRMSKQRIEQLPHRELPQTRRTQPTLFEMRGAASCMSHTPGGEA